MSTSADIAITTVTSILIITSIVGNCLVCAVVTRNPLIHLNKLCTHLSSCWETLTAESREKFYINLLFARGQMNFNDRKSVIIVNLTLSLIHLNKFCTHLIVSRSKKSSTIEFLPGFLTANDRLRNFQYIRVERHTPLDPSQSTFHLSQRFFSNTQAAQSH